MNPLPVYLGQCVLDYPFVVGQNSKIHQLGACNAENNLEVDQVDERVY